MSVKVGDKVVQRPISHYDVDNRRYVPETQPHEELMWFVASPIPTIVQVRERDEEETYECCALCEMPFFVKRCTRCGYEPA